MAGDAYSSYLEAVEYIESFLPASGSERWRLVLNRFGNPHEKFRSVHVAGTSGKGSVAMMTGEILRASGLRIGVHVKPYVQSATENIILDGRYISCGDYAGLIEKVKPVFAGLTPEEYSRFGPVTWSEVTKLLPLLSFAERKVDYGVVEAGVGGREDLTNVLTPEVSVITSVGMDHSDLLGGTIDLIAHQKAGVIKQGVPSVTAVRQRDALEAISAEAKQKGSRLSILGRDFRVRVTKVGLGGTEFDYRSEGRRLKKVSLRMVGRHQAINAAVAITATDAMRRTGGKVDERAIRAGLAGARLPGRFELVQERPPVILDVAHNVQKVGVLLNVLEDVFGRTKVTFVLGFLEGKDARRMVGLMAHKARHFVFTNPSVRGKKPIDLGLLKNLAGKLTGVPSLIDSDPMSAIEKALGLAGDKGIVCVTGSLYLVGKVRGKWFDVREVAESRSSYPG
ncbi:MAG: folylpolyglutamate synthase/dihydrofolate synthase family protein [Nitrososphaerales archaeon]|jgi:dihydrofolate synthase/folylpolyglutamate synthase